MGQFLQLHRSLVLPDPQFEAQTAPVSCAVFLKQHGAHSPVCVSQLQGWGGTTGLPAAEPVRGPIPGGTHEGRPLTRTGHCYKLLVRCRTCVIAMAPSSRTGL